MAEMAACRERHAQNRITGPQQTQHHGLVRLGAGMGLDVDPAAIKQLCRTLNCQALGHIDELATAIVASTRITFRIFVGQDRALCRQHRLADDVLRGN